MELKGKQVVQYEELDKQARERARLLLDDTNEIYIIVFNDGFDFKDLGLENDYTEYEDKVNDPVSRCSFVCHGNSIVVFNKRTLKVLNDDLKKHYHTYKTWEVTINKDGSFSSSIYNIVTHL